MYFDLLFGSETSFRDVIGLATGVRDSPIYGNMEKYYVMFHRYTYTHNVHDLHETEEVLQMERN